MLFKFADYIKLGGITNILEVRNNTQNNLDRIEKLPVNKNT